MSLSCSSKSKNKRGGRNKIKRGISPDTLHELKHTDWHTVEPLAASSLLFRLEYSRHGEPTNDQLPFAGQHKTRRIKWKRKLKPPSAPTSASVPLDWTNGHLHSPGDLVVALSAADSAYNLECIDVNKLERRTWKGVDFLVTDGDYPVKLVALTGYIVAKKIRRDREWHYLLDDGTAAVDVVCIDDRTAPTEERDRFEFGPNKRQKTSHVVDSVPDFANGTLVTVHGQVRQKPYEGLDLVVKHIRRSCAIRLEMNDGLTKREPDAISDPNVELYHHLEARQGRQHRQRARFDCNALVRQSKANVERSDAVSSVASSPSSSRPFAKGPAPPKPLKLPKLASLSDSDFGDQMFATYIVNWVKKRRYDQWKKGGPVQDARFTLADLRQSTTLRSFAKKAAEVHERSKQLKLVHRKADIDAFNDDTSWHHRDRGDYGVVFAPSTKTLVARVLPAAVPPRLNRNASEKENPGAMGVDKVRLKGALLEYAMTLRFERAIRYLRSRGSIILVDKSKATSRAAGDAVRRDGHHGKDDDSSDGDIELREDGLWYPKFSAARTTSKNGYVLDLPPSSPPNRASPSQSPQNGPGRHGRRQVYVLDDDILRGVPSPSPSPKPPSKRKKAPTSLAAATAVDSDSDDEIQVVYQKPWKAKYILDDDILASPSPSPPASSQRQQPCTSQSSSDRSSPAHTARAGRVMKKPAYIMDDEICVTPKSSPPERQETKRNETPVSIASTAKKRTPETVKPARVRRRREGDAVRPTNSSSSPPPSSQVSSAVRAVIVVDEDAVTVNEAGDASDEGFLLPSSSQGSDDSVDSATREEQSYELVSAELLYEPLLQLVTQATRTTSRAALSGYVSGAAAKKKAVRYETHARIGIDEDGVRRALEGDDKWVEVASNDVVRVALDDLCEEGKIEVGASGMYKSTRF